MPFSVLPKGVKKPFSKAEIVSIFKTLLESNRQGRTKADRSFRPMLELLEGRTLLSSPNEIEVRQLSLAANDLVYDAVNQTIYASVPSSAGFGVGNSITAIDPNAGTIGKSVFAGSEPTTLAVSDNGQYVYVGLNGADAVARFNVPNQNVDLQFWLPTQTLAEDIAVVPGSPQSVAVIRFNPNVSPGGNGIAIYDNGVQRPDVAFPGDSMAFASATTLYAYDDESTAFQFTQMAVSSNGLTVVKSISGLLYQFNQRIKYDAGLVYSTNGQVIDPQALRQVGRYNASGSVVPDSAAGLTYFLSGDILQVFDQATFTPIESFTIPGVIGGGDSLIRWGANGLAFRTSGNQVFLLNLLSVSATPIPVNVAEGTAFTGPVATIIDPNTNDTAADFTATINWGDGNTSAGVVSGGAGHFTVSGSHTYLEEGSFPINVQITRLNTVPSVNVQSMATVAESDLSVNTSPFTAPESQMFSGTVATFSDPGSPDNAGIFSATILWGDGSSSVGNITGSNGSFTVSGSHAYGDENNLQFTVSIAETGSPSPSVQAFGTASVSEADALSITPVTISPTEGFAFTGTVANFSDTDFANSANDFAATIDWGDGGTSTGTVGGSGGTFSITGSHTYLAEGTYNIIVRVTDDGSGTATATVASMAKVVAEPIDIVGRESQTGQILVSLSTGSSFNSSLWATWDPSVTWVDVLTGDFNRDGRTDIAARDSATGNWWVGISTGSSFTTTLWTTWAPNVTWTDVQVGDFTGDGEADIAGRDLQTGNWWVAQSTGSSFTNSLWTSWYAGVTWTDVKVGDFNGDGKADIAGRVLQSGDWWVAQSTGSSFTNSRWTTWAPNVTWVDVQVGDFNGDGKADLAGRVLQSGDWWVAQSTGSSFANSLWTTWDPKMTWVDVRVGDFNGDGKDDIIGRASQSGQWWVGQSSGSNFNNSLWATWSTGFTWVDIQIGDFNGDGKADITGRALETGQWWTGVSTGSSFNTNLWATWATNVTWADVRAGDFA